MPAPTQYYVDPSIAGNSGAGTVGDPYGDLEWALTQITRDATNGDQINVKAGTTETLVAALDIAGDYGNGGVRAPLIFRGYTSSANDGGIGDISGGGSVAIVGDITLNYIFFVDMKLHNTGSVIVVSMNDNCLLANCEVANTSNIAIDLDNVSAVVNCYVHTCTGTKGINVGTQSTVLGNAVIASVTTAGITVSSGTCVAAHNIVKLTATNGADGITWSDFAVVFNNTVFATAGTGSGFVGSGAGRDHMILLNNLAAGFSGTGGDGFDFSSSDHTNIWGYNSTYNCTNDENKSTGEILIDLGGDQLALASSPFTTAPGTDFAITTALKALGMPNFTGGGAASGTTQYMDIGAAQREEPAGGSGGLVSHPGMKGGLVG